MRRFRSSSKLLWLSVSIKAKRLTTKQKAKINNSGKVEEKKKFMSGLGGKWGSYQAIIGHPSPPTVCAVCVHVRVRVRTTSASRFPLCTAQQTVHEGPDCASITLMKLHPTTSTDAPTTIDFKSNNMSSEISFYQIRTPPPLRSPEEQSIPS